MPVDKDILGITDQLPEPKQRIFLTLTKFIQARQRRAAGTKKLRAIAIEDFADTEITETDIWHFLEILRKVYRTVQEPPITSVLTVHKSLPNPGITSGPDGKKYATGLEPEVITKIYELLLEKFGEIKPVFTKVEKPIVQEIVMPGSRYPLLIADDNRGYLKFYKEGRRIDIGKITGRKYLLLSVLMKPLGTARTIDSVFDVISQPKDWRDSDLKDAYRSDFRKRELIDYAIKDLQKIKGLTGKITLRNYGKDKIALKLG